MSGGSRDRDERDPLINVDADESVVNDGASDGALRESEARFKTLVENMSDIVVELDEQRFISWLSPSICDVIGRDPETLVGTSVLPIVHPDDVAALLSGLDLAYSTMKAVEFSYRLLHDNGEWRWIEGAGRCFLTSVGSKHFVGAGRDVTEYKTLVDTLERQHRTDQQVKSLSERFLAASAGRLREAALEVLEGTAELARADIAYIHPLPKHERASEAASPDFRPIAWRSPGLEAAEQGLPEACWNELRAGHVVRFVNRRGVLPTGERAWKKLEARGVHSMVGIPLFSKRGLSGVLGLECHREERSWSDHELGLLGLIGEIFSTSMQRIQAQADLQDSQTQLIQAQKMDAIGRLAGGIAHEFNNLLTIIIGYCRFLTDAVDAEHQHDLGEIHHAAERAADLTRQLLAFSRREPSRARCVDLNDVVFDVRRMIERLLGVEVELDFDLSELPRHVHADSKHLEQVLINMVVNARDAMPEGGTITLSTFEQQVDLKGCRRLGLSAPGPYNVLEVTDTGQGMDEDSLQYIFEPFYTTKDVGGGTGLGLSIAYSVVREQAGAISVESKRNQGTTFSILLPRAEAPGDEEPAPGTNAGARGDETLLIVEDEAALRRMMVRIARHAGYRVHEAESGAAALQLVESIDGAIDLLLSDVMMAGMSGYELADRLSAERSDLPVIFVSGHPLELGREPTAQESARRFLRKPFAAADLLGTLREMLDEA